MLIGPSITLEELEKHLSERVYEIKLLLPKLHKQILQLQDDFKRIPRTVIEVKQGEEIEVANPDFIKIPDAMKLIETQVKDFQEQLDFMEEKLAELDDIEDRSKGKGNIDKSKEKVTLTLSDCLMLDLETTPAKGE